MSNYGASNNENKLYISFDNRLSSEMKDELRQMYSNYIKGVNESKGGYPTDSGFNIFNPIEIEFQLDMVHFVGSGVNAKLMVNGMPSGFWLVPRSSISKTPLMLANSIGLIDSDYRGELTGAFRCLNDKNITMTNNIVKAKEPQFKLVDGKYTCAKHTSLLQIVAPNMRPMKVEIVESLDQTQRGTGGFGSTTSGFSRFTLDDLQ